MLVLGQWAPDWLPLPPALPLGLCRWRGPAGADRVALTFDDGPHPDTTPTVLDSLDELGVRATFFCLGELVERHPGVLQLILERGHEVGLHGQRHVHHLARSARFIRRDLAAGLTALEREGVRPRFYRPPYGQVSGGTLVAARSLGLELVLWSAWGREWRDPDPASVAQRIGRRLGPGSIVLLHDTEHTSPPGSWRVGLAALPLVVADCERRGLRPVTMSELAGGG